MQTPKHILVFRFSAMGDVAMTVPVIRALTNQNPSLKITVVTTPFFKPIFRDLKNTKVFSADVKNKYKGVFGLYRLSRELNALDFDAVADLHNVLRTKILKIFLKKTLFYRIDKGRSKKKKLTTGKIFTPLKTTHQRYADVFDKLRLAFDLSQITFPPKKPLSKKLKSLISNEKPPIIGIAPFAAHQGKMYPLSQMNQVIDGLSKSYQIFLFGGGKVETKQLEDIANQYKNTTNLSGKISFDEELDMISNLDLMISMDSGNGHLAAMLGVKVISIWGVTHPYAGFAPFNQPLDYSLMPDRHQFPSIPTSVFGNKYPESYKNVAGSISVEKIIEKVNQVLNNSSDINS